MRFEMLDTDFIMCLKQTTLYFYLITLVAMDIFPANYL